MAFSRPSVESDVGRLGVGWKLGMHAGIEDLLERELFPTHSDKGRFGASADCP